MLDPVNVILITSVFWVLVLGVCVALAMDDPVGLVLIPIAFSITALVVLMTDPSWHKADGHYQCGKTPQYAYRHAPGDEHIYQYFKVDGLCKKVKVPY